MRILLLKATHFPFVAAIWAYENAPRKWWWGQNEEDMEQSEAWHSNLDPQLHRHALSSQTYPQPQRQATPSKSILDKVRHGHNRFDPSPVPKKSSLAALMSRSEVSLVRRPATGEDRHGSTVDARNTGDGRADASTAADLRELSCMVSQLSDLMEDLKSRLDQQSGLSGNEDNEG